MITKILNKLKDPFLPKWKHSNPEVRIQAINNILDIETLTSITTNDPDSRVINRAKQQISFLRVKLESILKGESYKKAKKNINKYIQSEDDLYKIALEASLDKVQKYAIKKISDNEMLNKIVNLSKQKSVSEFALFQSVKNNSVSDSSPSGKPIIRLSVHLPKNEKSDDWELKYLSFDKCECGGTLYRKERILSHNYSVVKCKKCSKETLYVFNIYRSINQFLKKQL